MKIEDKIQLIKEMLTLQINEAENGLQKFLVMHTINSYDALMENNLTYPEDVLNEALNGVFENKTQTKSMWEQKIDKMINESKNK